MLSQVLVFALMLSSLILDNNKKVTNWISTGTSYEKIQPFDTNLEPTMSNLASARVIFKLNHSILVKKSSSSLYSKFILYIVFEFSDWTRNPTNNFPINNSLFGAVKLVRNTVKIKINYNGWEVAFDEEGSWTFGHDFAKNVVIFGDDNRSSSHTDNRENKFLVLGEGPTHGINW